MDVFPLGSSIEVLNHYTAEDSVVYSGLIVYLKDLSEPKDEDDRERFTYAPQTQMI